MRWSRPKEVRDTVVDKKVHQRLNGDDGVVEGSDREALVARGEGLAE